MDRCACVCLCVKSSLNVYCHLFESCALPLPFHFFLLHLPTLLFTCYTGHPPLLFVIWSICLMYRYKKNETFVESKAHLNRKKWGRIVLSIKINTTNTPTMSVYASVCVCLYITIQKVHLTPFNGMEGNTAKHRTTRTTTNLFFL